jgi:signal transduction histidine kinase
VSLSTWLLGLVALAAAATAVGTWVHARRRLERVARAVHELRSPLTAARLAAHVAARRCGWAALAPVDHELSRAGAALEDLDTARAGGRVSDRAEDVDAGDLLEEVCRTWAPLAWPVQRRVYVEPALVAPVVRADRQRLGQALGNLVANALEHGAGPVVLRCAVDRGRARLSVEDGGTGLPGPLGALTRRPRAGRGLRGRGLAIADEIARRHGGRLREERTTGRFRMVLELPLVAAEAASVAVGGVAGPTSGADDSPAGLRWGGLARPRSAGGARSVRR